MPKPLYGKGRKSKSRAAQSSDDAGRGWLTLITTLPEEQMHAAIAVALREEEASAGRCLPCGAQSRGGSEKLRRRRRR